jgi:hypothetical protein
MLGFGAPQFSRFVLSAAFFLSLVFSRAEVIYDNTATYLGNFVSDRREYGDQLDLGGTARRLTQIQFEYFGRFATNGDEAVKVRLYTNEKQYDRYRKEPTTLLFESDWLPINPGFGNRLLDGLNVLLPLHTVTFTVEFSGIAPDEEAGLLFYGPPTEGYSFNEFWMKGTSGRWFTILYSNTDPKMRASVGLRLIAEPDVQVHQQQPSFTGVVPLHEGTNSVRIAQTFTAEESGLLSHFTLNLDQVSSPARLRLLDTLDGRPGPNVLAARNIVRGFNTNQDLTMPFGVFLEKGKQYAIEISTTATPTREPGYLVAAGTNQYSAGSLFYRHESGGTWTEFTNRVTGLRDLDALFQVHLVPARPMVELRSPRPFDLFDAGEPILLRALHQPPEIGQITVMRFYRGSQEIGAVTNAPYEFIWTNALPGEHNLRAIAEDSFRRPFRSAFTPVLVRPQGAPENDLFARRIQIDGQYLRRIKPTASATTESGEPVLRAQSGTGGATLWWSWTAYDNSPVTISAQNSTSTNAHVAVFTGSSLSSLNLVTNGSPLVRFQPAPGVTYAISVDPAVRGDQVVLDLATTDVTISSVSNLVFDSGEAFTLSLSGSRLRQITNVNLFAAGEWIGRSPVAPATLTTTVQTNGFLSLVAVAADQFGVETVSMPFPVTVRPRNDSFSRRTTLTEDRFAITFSPNAGTLESFEPSLPSIGLSQPGSAWWSWTAHAAGPVRLQLASGTAPAALAVFIGNSLADLQLLTQAAAHGAIQFNAQPGRTYHVRVVANALDAAPLTLSMRRVMFVATPLQDGSVTLQFDSLGRPLRLEYSPDMRLWKQVQAPFQPSGDQTFSFTDSGPPGSETHPAQDGVRFYRLVVE